MRRMTALALAIYCLVGIPTALGAAPGTFPCLAHDAQHSGVADAAGPPALGSPRFVTVVEGMELVGPSTPVVADFKIYVYAEQYDEAQGYGDACVLAFDELGGSLLWSRPVGERVFGSWSSPTAFFGEVRGETVESVFVGSGAELARLDAHTGAVQWSVALDRTVVNASPVVGADKVFLSDTSGYGPGGKLYAFDALDGSVLWSREIGQTNGNTPAYAAGAVYVATADAGVFALDADNGTPLWHTEPFGSQGCFGGLSVRDGAVYAASYGFYGGEDNSVLVKLSAADGALIWSAPAERTNMIPIVTGDTLVLAGGLHGYGSRQKLECFDASSGALLWSYTGAGGWLEQPCTAAGLLYVGLIADEGYFFEPALNLQILDVSKQPGNPGFCLDTYGPAGSSPSVANGNVYSIGMLDDATALYAFGPCLDVLTDVHWDQATTSVVITFASQQGVDYVLERAEADTYADGLTWTSLPADTLTGTAAEDAFHDNLTVNPLTGSFRFYRVKRGDGTHTSPQTAGVFELPLEIGWTMQDFFISTPLIPDEDHASVQAVIGTQLNRNLPNIRQRVATAGINNRLDYNRTTKVWSVAYGNAFDITPGEGYRLFAGGGVAQTLKLRLTGYVPEQALSVLVAKPSWTQTDRWVAYSMPRTRTLDTLGLHESVTGWNNSMNTLKLRPLGEGVWSTYKHDGAMWYDVSAPGVNAGSTPIACGEAVIFTRFGTPIEQDVWAQECWYDHPPNN